MFCANKAGSDTCVGDSGGPAVKKSLRPEDDVLLGITSWGPRQQCNETDSEQAPAVFTLVHAYMEWINATINFIETSKTIIQPPFSLATEISDDLSDLDTQLIEDSKPIIEPPLVFPATEIFEDLFDVDP